MIFAAPEPIAANRAVWVDKYPGDGNLQMSMWTSLDQLSSGDSYQVVSSLSRATVDTLRAAGTDYPAAVRDRYLQLPASLPQRVRLQAKQIVDKAGAVGAYDQASALEAWLRLNITYNDQIAGPKPGEDGVDYVLFESRQGYCDYYASAMAVMARSLGIPARVATGYASGEYDPERGVYQVHQFNAHTWVEVYFPKYGWIEFEPTASQPSIARPVGVVASTLDDPTHDPNANDQAARFRNRPIKDEEFDPLQGPASPVDAPQSLFGSDQTLSLLIVGGGGVVLLVVVVVTLMWLYENRGGTRRLHGGEWVFAHMTRMSVWLRVHLTSSQTPYE
ncbi:MAG TPA: transglutaminase-like domain-containing protein, partial [Anaerolineae bacterium]